MDSKAVATEILRQLGGYRFTVMTGARDIVAHDEGRGGVWFKLPRGLAKDGINMVKITLTAMDDYIVETLKVRGLKVTPVGYRENVYSDTLRAVFTTLTGLDTSLGTMGRS